MDVETSRHDEMWTTRRRVMTMNVDTKRRRRWSVIRRRLIISDEWDSFTNRTKPWREGPGT